MITPTFKVDQDDNFVYITINTPHVRAQDVDLYVEGSEFRFYLRPYFLRLHFPGNIIEDDQSKATYDPSAGQFTIKVSKETKGEQFADLDLLTKLLARTGETEKKKKPMIEVVGEESTEMEEAEEFNWEIPQELPKEQLSTHTYYGFNQQYTGYFTHVQETLNEINDIQSPETSTIESRREERLQLENERFDEDHYCTDFAEDEDIRQLMKYKTVYAKELKRMQKENDEAKMTFTRQEEEMMRQLPRKEYLVSNEKSVYLGLVDLLFAYSYNHRMTEGEGNVESAWCVGKLSSTLSCLEQFSTLKEVIITSFRRSLIYPLYRHFEFSEKVVQDVYILFKLGKRAILKALLEMKYIFDHHDVYYIYSKIYLDDYCVWIQHASDHVLRTLAHELHHLKINKNELGWDLDEIEEVIIQKREKSKLTKKSRLRKII
ncbi:hypothetical protein RMCBS344292_13890 [Rhizopus microsporus]|nr:hypothetical protein RMCBS344292_13890 [Rhizopus microsporus]